MTRVTKQWIFGCLLMIGRGCRGKVQGAKAAALRGCGGRVRPRFMPRIALYAGSFDPVTNGHIDVVRHAVRLADRLVIAIGVHPGKTPLFSAEERTAMLHENCAPFAREAKCELSCITFSDLVVDGNAGPGEPSLQGADGGSIHGDAEVVRIARLAAPPHRGREGIRKPSGGIPPGGMRERIRL